jgi:hypothetical protein
MDRARLFKILLSIADDCIEFHSKGKSLYLINLIQGRD